MTVSTTTLDRLLAAAGDVLDEYDAGMMKFHDTGCAGDALLAEQIVGNLRFWTASARREIGVDDGRTADQRAGA